MFMLEEKYLTTIKKIISQKINLDEFEVFIFGSQAMGKPNRTSDIDIGIKGEKPLDLSILGAIKEEFEESDLPQTVDVIDFSKTSDKFRQIAQQNAYYIN